MRDIIKILNKKKWKPFIFKAGSFCLLLILGPALFPIAIELIILVDLIGFSIFFVFIFEYVKVNLFYIFTFFTKIFFSLKDFFCGKNE